MFKKKIQGGVVNRTNSTYVCLIPKASEELKITDFERLSKVMSLRL